MADNLEIISLKQNQTLKLEVGSSNGRPTYAEYTHAEIVALLTRRERSVSRKSKTSESRASRTIGLMCRAIHSGQWSTGAKIHQPQVISRLAELLSTLTDEQVLALTPKADAALNDLLKNERLQSLFSAHLVSVKRFWLR